MKITVILATYNRCESLRTTLSCLSKQVLPEETTWEILVVDNHSSDGTRAVVEEFCRRYPDRYRYLFEPRPGKSRALNTAIRESDNEVLAFIDDDVTVDPNWLDRLTAPLQSSEWSGAGGPVLLRWSCPPPDWMPLAPRYLGALAGFNPVGVAGELHDPPFGTNMAFRRSMFEKYGTFREDLGPSASGDTLRPNEDTDFGRRVLSGGDRLWYEAAAIVYHPVPEERLQKRYLLNWWFDKGRAEAREAVPQVDLNTRNSMLLRSFRRVLLWATQWILAIEPRHRFECRLKTYWNLGQVRELARSGSRRAVAAPNHKSVRTSASVEVTTRVSKR